MLIDDYTLTAVLGKGTFGDVFLTKKNNSNLTFATKRMEREFAEHPKYCKFFVNEVSILRNISHKNIVKVVDLKKTKKHYYIIMEFCNGGSLKDNLEKYKKMYNKPFPEKMVQHIMRQIVSAINYLHGIKIVHRDLKLENILVNFINEEDKNKINLLNSDIKIVDFGFATHISNVSLLKVAIGSPFTMDPRILHKYINHEKSLQNYDEKADIWSLGILCYQMLVGEYAFSAQNEKELCSKIEEGTFKMPITLSKETISFLMNMLQYDPKKRSNAEEISKHPFLTNSIEDFSFIDLKKVMNKVNYDNLFINIKNNQTICAVVNKEGVKQLNISQNELAPKKTEKKSLDYNENLNSKDINHSAPILNSKTKDPILNQLLNIKVPEKEKNIIKSLVLINEDSTNNKMTNIPQPLNSMPPNQNNEFKIPQDNYKKYLKKTSGINQMNQMNQNLNQPMQIFSQKQMANNYFSFSDNKNNPAQINMFNNQNELNNNRGTGSFRTISSQNLGNFQFQDFQNNFNTMPFRYDSSQNESFTFRPMNNSDKKVPNLGINNALNNQFLGQFQSTSSKNLNSGNLNFLNFQ